MLFTASEMKSSDGPGDRAGPKLDFRFADAEDANDIAEVVNDAFAVENVEGVASEPAFAFRRGPRLVLEELVAELEASKDLRWIVLETPVPEERVVAAVAILLEAFGSRKVAVLKCLAVAPDMEGTGIGSQLLRKAESCCRGLGCRVLPVCLPQA